MPIAHSHGSKIAYDVTGDGPVLLLHPGMAASREVYPDRVQYAPA